MVHGARAAGTAIFLLPDLLDRAHYGQAISKWYKPCQALKQVLTVEGLLPYTVFSADWCDWMWQDPQKLLNPHELEITNSH
jgi:hypothetical protein